MTHYNRTNSRYRPVFARVLLLFSLGLGAARDVRADCACGGDWFCVNQAEARRGIEKKKAAARARGLPERLVVLFDRLAPCRYCVATAPDWPKLVYLRSDGLILEIPWSAHNEWTVREDMRAGRIRRYAIDLGTLNGDCVCCPADPTAASTYKAETKDTPTWDEQLGLDRRQAIVFDSTDQLGADAHLTDPGPPTEPPPRSYTAYDPPVLRVVQTLCNDKTCLLLAERANEAALGANRRANDLRRLIRELDDAIYDWDRSLEELYRWDSAASTRRNQQRREEALQAAMAAEGRVAALRQAVRRMMSERDELVKQRQATLDELVACELLACGATGEVVRDLKEVARKWGFSLSLLKLRGETAIDDTYGEGDDLSGGSTQRASGGGGTLRFMRRSGGRAHALLGGQVGLMKLAARESATEGTAAHLSAQGGLGVDVASIGSLDLRVGVGAMRYQASQPDHLTIGERQGPAILPMLQASGEMQFPLDSSAFLGIQAGMTWGLGSKAEDEARFRMGELGLTVGVRW